MCCVRVFSNDITDYLNCYSRLDKKVSNPKFPESVLSTHKVRVEQELTVKCRCCVDVLLFQNYCASFHNSGVYLSVPVHKSTAFIGIRSLDYVLHVVICYLS